MSDDRPMFTSVDPETKLPEEATVDALLAVVELELLDGKKADLVDGTVPAAQLPPRETIGKEYPFTNLAQWSILHGLGRRPHVSIYVGDVEIDTDVTATTTSVAITFASPTSGIAVLV